MCVCVCTAPRGVCLQPCGVLVSASSLDTLKEEVVVRLFFREMVLVNLGVLGHGAKKKEKEKAGKSPTFW